MKKDSHSSRLILLDMAAQRSRVRKLIERGIDYNKLLDFLIEDDELFNEEATLPSLKELSEKLQLSYSVIRRYLSHIYTDLLDIDQAPVHQFRRTEYWFELKAQGKWASFKTLSLQVVPRVGEEIGVPFFNAELECRNFHVYRVTHYFEDDVHTVSIDLKEGSYNLYWHQRLDEAYLKGEVSIHEFYQLSDYQLKDKLGLDRY